MKQQFNRYILAHKEDDAALLTIGMNQEGFAHKLVYDYLKIPVLNDHFQIFKNGYLDWFCNRKIWYKIVNIVLNKIKNDKTFGKKIWEKTMVIGKKLEEGCNNVLKNIKNDKVIFEDLRSIIEQLHQLYSIGMVPPISDIQHFSFTKMMEGIIAVKIEKFKLNKPIGDYFSVLTTPLNENYFQRSEKDLLKLAIEIKKKKLIREKVCEKINQYLKKYNWIEYAHLGPALTIGAVIKKINQYHYPEKKLIELNLQRKRLTKDQKKFEKELKLTEKEKQIFITARYFGQHKACRLAMAFMANYTINEALRVLAQKYGYKVQELRNLSRGEFFEMIKSGKIVPKNILKQRQRFCVNHVVSYGNVKIYTGRAAKDFIHKYVPKEKIEGPSPIIKGGIACTGRAVGKVKIINSSADMTKMKKGDILVAIQTMPQLLPVMKLAAAFVTDIGGLTCHAAIVAREMNKPCIIGTWNATKILKDGQFVEVDANKGVVKILKRK